MWYTWGEKESSTAEMKGQEGAEKGEGKRLHNRFLYFLWASHKDEKTLSKEMKEEQLIQWEK